jgi:tRNA (cmo5U34)-methyltransferase
VTKDTLFSNPRSPLASFKFDDDVASVFTDMINRSVPGYAMMLEMIGVITGEYAKPNTRCYDLGCSLGASTLSIRHSLPDAGCTLIAVDNAEAMVTRCRAAIAKDTHPAPVQVLCDDILNIPIENASLVVLNFTLQFIPPELRKALLSRIYEGLNPGGVLVLSEKCLLAKPQEQETLTRLYHDFKRKQGYSDLEIAQKRSALENVLIPDTREAHHIRLTDAGFEQVTHWFQCFTFMSLLAKKTDQ